MSKRTQAETIKKEMTPILSGLEERVDKALYVQLFERLKSWVTKQAPGTKLPSERWMSETANVNRRTLRKALASLVEQGLLERFQKGTIIPNSKNDTEFSSELDSVQTHQLNPLLTDFAVQQPGMSELVIAILEVLPGQKKFWTQAIEEINKQNVGFKFKSCFVPVSVNTIDKYIDFTTKNQCDIIMTTGGMINALKNKNQLIKLSDSSCSHLLKSDFFWSRLTRQIDPILPWGMPVHISLQIMALNRTMVDSDIPGRHSSFTGLKQLSSFLEEISPFLKPSTILTNNPLNLVLAMGSPKQPLQLKDFFSYVTASANFFSTLKLLKKHVQWQVTYQEILHLPFIKQKQALYFGPSACIFSYLDKLSFPYSIYWMLPENNFLNSCAATALSISPHCQKQKLAELAIRHFTSPVIQEILASSPINCPIRKDALLPLLKRVGNSDFKMFDKQLSQTQFFPDSQIGWEWFSKAGMEKHYKAILDGTESLDQNFLNEAKIIAETIYDNLLR